MASPIILITKKENKENNTLTKSLHHSQLYFEI